MNVTITLTTEQVADFIQQMPLEEQLKILRELSNRAWIGRKDRMKYLESKVRQVCAERGQDWDAMDDDARLQFIDDVIHEDSGCNQ